jgi:hypothetical protein
MDTFKDEVWRRLPGYEKIYAVSNLGRIKSLDRIVFYSNGSQRKLIGKILKPTLNKVGAKAERYKTVGNIRTDST